MSVGLEHFLVLSAILFSIGFYGALSKRNVITVLMSIEIMFNAVNIAMVAMSRYIAPSVVLSELTSTEATVVQTVLTGQVFAVFIVTVAAAEVALALGIVMSIYRNQRDDEDYNPLDIGQLQIMRR